jgi:hypothetical protein
MTTHELARKLLELPDVPVCVHDRDGDLYEISEQHVWESSNACLYSPTRSPQPMVAGLVVLLG